MVNDKISVLQQFRSGYVPKGPDALLSRSRSLGIVEGEVLSCSDPDVSSHFPESSGKPLLTFRDGGGETGTVPLRVGVVLSGGQAPGGHNVIAGLLDGVRAAHPDGRVFGFIAGPGGILRGDAIELTPEKVEPYRNTGGFDIIGSGRDKIEGEDQLQSAMESCSRLDLSGLVVIGGDDSNTNAAVMAEHFTAHGSRTAVVGVPKTIDGDLRNDWVEQSFGFDTATKVYSELIGNICRDADSAKKYWHFIKLMGRSASHVTLECALQIRPDITLIGEEVRANNMTLRQVVDVVAGAVIRRSQAGRNYGVCLVPEGLIEFIPEVGVLIGRLNDLLAKYDADEAVQKLPADSTEVFNELPGGIARQLLIDRDSHGNVQVSRIDTEKLLMELVKAAGQGEGEVQRPGPFLWVRRTLLGAVQLRRRLHRVPRADRRRPVVERPDRLHVRRPEIGRTGIGLGAVRRAGNRPLQHGDPPRSEEAGYREGAGGPGRAGVPDLCASAGSLGHGRLLSFPRPDPVFRSGRSGGPAHGDAAATVEGMKRRA